MTSAASAVLPASLYAPSSSAVSANDKTASGNGASAKSAIARSLTGALAFYFKRPVKLFRPTRVSAWTAFNEIATSGGHKGQVDTGFLRQLVAKQGWVFFIREAFPPLFVNSIVGFTLFSTYTLSESGLRYLQREGQANLSPYAVPFLAGATAGAAQSIISSPLDNVRAVLASPSSQIKAGAGKQQWRGWRRVAFEAFFPKWLTTTTPLTATPGFFLLNWWRSSWSLFTFTLLRDSLGFAAFFSLFELSRTLAKKAGKAVDRLQTNLEELSQSLGIDLQELLENDMIDRRWPGRVVQALVIVSCGIFAGIGYGIVGRPFDKARSVVWNGLENWAREKKKQAREFELEKEKREATRASAARIGSAAIGPALRSIPSSKSSGQPVVLSPKAVTQSVPSSISHRTKHHRLTSHETRLPVHPPRLAEPPRHPLKRPSIMHPARNASSQNVPSALRLLRDAYRKEGALAMLGFSSASASFLGNIIPPKSVLSRSQLAKSPRNTYTSASSKASATSRPSAAFSLESLAEHPALGGSSVYIGLPPPSQELLKTSHRKQRWWQASRANIASASRKVLAAPGPGSWRRKWRGRLTVSNVFRIIPPYCFGFLVYSMMSDDFNS